eukprot:m.67044 g.67044  ORF g.67044 m.67044 type:complete len:285 (+) comp23754_c0_seq1:87-941(+)
MVALTYLPIIIFVLYFRCAVSVINIADLPELKETVNRTRNELTAIYTSVARAEATVSTLREHPNSISAVALYSYSLGIIQPNFTLPGQPYGLNFTQSIQETANTSGIKVTPVIICGGPNAEANWKLEPVWTKVFVAEAIKYNYDGYVMDMEISHTSSSHIMEDFVTFLDGFAAGLQDVNKTLAIITRYDFPKTYVVKSTIQNVFSYNYVSQTASEGYVRELTTKYPSKAGVVIEPHVDWNGTAFFDSIQSQQPYHCKHLAMWSDLQGISNEWMAASKAWLQLDA